MDARRDPFDVAVAGCLAAVEADLGRLRGQYRGRVRVSRVQLVVAVAYLVLGGWLIRKVLGEVLGAVDVAPGEAALLGLGVLMGVSAGALGGVLLHGFFRPGEWWFGYLDDGVIVSREGRQPLAFRWEQVARVRYGPGGGALGGGSRRVCHELSFSFVEGGRPYRLRRLAGDDWSSLGPQVVAASGRSGPRPRPDNTPQPQRPQRGGATREIRSDV